MEHYIKNKVNRKVTFMYLKSLEIKGFKSFPERIELQFDKGITAIVGPNGSGKSNIGDAVRWVLGEQSSKTLRGGKMEDVIFAGTQAKKAMGTASVTLNIVNDKNSGRYVPDAPEGVISVTRKLHRSGESEYIINGAEARLRDIVELFMDTGLGRDGYAIIGQGKIADIVSNKSADRREIFEEASGISKLRYKRDNANRDLERAEESLLRLRDIMAELESRIEPLREQSETAQKFITLEERRKITEITVWVSQMDTLTANIDSLSDEILENKSAYETSSADNERLEHESEELYRKSGELQLAIETLRGEIAAIEKQSAEVTSEIAVAENDIAHAEARIDELKTEIKHSEAAGTSVSDVINNKLSDIENIEKQIAETEYQIKDRSAKMLTLSSEAGEFDEKLREVNNKLSALYIKQSEYRFTAQNNAEVIESSLLQAEEADKQAESIRAELSELETESAELSASLNNVSEQKSEFENRKSGLEKLFSGRQAKLDEANAAAENLRLKAQENESRIRLLTDLEKNMEGFAHSVKEILKMGHNNVIRGIHGTVGDLLSVDRELTLAIETALGAAIQNVIVENEDTAKRSINHLKETRAGRATFLPLTSVKGRTLEPNIIRDLSREEGFIGVASEIVRFDSKYTGIYENLLGRTAVFEDIDTAAEAAKRFRYAFKIVTSDGQVINAGGSFTGGSSAKQGGILSRKNEIERLSAAQEGIINDLTAAKDRAKKLSDETNKLHFDIEGVKEAIRAVDNDLVRFDAEKRRIVTVSEKLGSQLSVVIKTAEGLRKRAEELRAGAADTAKNTAENDLLIAELETILSKGTEKQSDLHNRREALSHAMSEMRLRETALSKDKDAIFNEISTLEEQKKRSGDNSVRLTLMMNEQQQIIIEKRGFIEQRKTDNTGAETEIEKIKAQINELRAQHAENEQIAAKNREASKLILERREIYGKNLSRAEERRKISEDSFEHLVNELQEQYGLYLSEAREQAAPHLADLDMQAASRELASLRNKIKALGVVNLSAIEEFREISERYGFMKAQTDDIIKSKRELERLINELTDRMKTMFSESFSSINSHFKRIFIELFGGGKAELKLTEPDDILESGIEIAVAPPGKVIKNLSLLSGGEQAFVAIAIYFAILTVKPSPFCILDEIEAALDDVNVTKYARYLRKFTDTTQFICVTHRRGTMDESDILYGVTMQEKGISRVLRLEN
jgi:chromosome segregation protein